MKTFISFLKFILVMVVTFLLLTCCSSSKPHCPTYADNGDYPIMIPPIVLDHYDTVVSIRGDTTLLPIPYTPTKGEQIAVNTMLGLISTTIIYALITHE